MGRSGGSLRQSVDRRDRKPSPHQSGHDALERARGGRARMTAYQQFIGGAWMDASNGGTWDVLNPATEEVVQTVPYGTGADCELAIDAAVAAFPSWSTRTPYERGAVLKKAADLIRVSAEALARTTVLESGKPLVQARGEWLVCADLFEWFAEE